MLFFNKEDVYIGYSLEDLAKVRGVLKREGIKYSYKVIDHSGNSARRNFGSFGLNSKYEKQYIVSVKKKDSEKAMYLVNHILHS